MGAGESTKAAFQVLLIEQSPVDTLRIEESAAPASGSEFSLSAVNSLSEGMERLKNGAFDVVLLDLMLTDSKGLQALISIQNHSPTLPVIILTGYADELLALQAVESGAQDYLIKSTVNAAIIQRSIRYAIQRKQFQNSLVHRINYDPLTGLSTRTLFENRLEMALARIKRSKGGVGVFFLDLDLFQQINQTLGHEVGDVLLQDIAKRLRRCLRPYDTTARFGGDEFSVLIEDLSQPKDCDAVAGKLLKQFVAPFTADDQEIMIGANIGVASCFADEAASVESMISRAEEAMHRSKQARH